MNLFRWVRMAWLISLTAAAQPAFGQTFNLTSGTQSWNVAGNWTPNGVPNGQGVSVAFNTPTGPDLTVQLNAAITIGTLNFTNNGSGTTNDLILQNGGGGSLTFDVVSGNAAINYAGTNTNTNNLDLNASITLNDALEVTNNNTVGTGTATMSFSGALSGGGGFIKNGLGRVSMTTVAKAYTGATIINQGRLRFTSVGVADQTSSVTVNNGGMLMLDTAATFTFGTSAATSVTLNGAGAGEVAQGLGALRAQTAGATLANNTTLGSDATIHSETGTLTMSGAFSGSSTLTKTGNGTLAFATTTANTHTGGVTVNAGAITYSASSAFGGGALTFAQSTGANTTVNFNSIQTISNLTSTWTNTTGTQSQTLNTGASAANIATINQTTNTAFGNGAVATLTGVVSGSGGIALASSNGSSLTCTGNNAYSAGTTINSGTLFANNSTGSATGTGNVTVNNGGVLGGSGTVGAGAIAVNINNGGVVAPGAAANSVGTLTITGEMDVNGAYSWNISQTAAGSNTEVTAGESDAGSVRDLLVLGTGLGGGSALRLNEIISVDPLGGMTVELGKFYSWRIAQLANGTTAQVDSTPLGTTPLTTGFTIAGAGAAWGSFSLTSSGGFVFLNVRSVPEPSQLAFVSLVAVGAALPRLRRRWRN